MTFDHDLKLKRAWEHLQNLRIAEAEWLNGDHHSLGQERDAQSGDVTISVTMTEQPPTDPFSLLIGDFLHNMRSALDLLAYALANAYTKPLPHDIAESSEFPIFGDENKRGQPGWGPRLFRDNGHAKIAGWHPNAKTVVEGLQPYQRRQRYRSHFLWHLQELDRVNKHRLLHTVFSSFSGAFIDLPNCINVARFGPGELQILGGDVGANTPVAVVPHVKPIDSKREVHVEVEPALRIAFTKGTPCVEDEPVVQTFYDLYRDIIFDIFRPLRVFL